MRLVARRIPFATTWTLPKWRVNRTRMRSASPRSTVRRTIASARYVRDAIEGEWYRLATRCERWLISSRSGGHGHLRYAGRGDRRRDPLAPHAGRAGAAALLRDDAVPP